MRYPLYMTSFSGVEKKVMYRGYRMRLATTGPLSNSEHVRRACFAATPTASPQGPAPITARSSIAVGLLSRHFDDLVAMRADAHVLDRRMGEVLQPVQIGPGGRGQIGEAAHGTERLLPAGQRSEEHTSELQSRLHL